MNYDKKQIAVDWAGEFPTKEDLELDDWYANERGGGYREQLKILKDLEGARIVFHSMNYGDYCGSCVTIFERDGKYYEVHGSHCSCNGLETQWDPEETSLTALLVREFYFADDEVTYNDDCHVDGPQVREDKFRLNQALREEVKRGLR